MTRYVKDPDDVADYGWDWAPHLAQGETITTSTWDVTAGLTSTDFPDSHTDTTTTIWLSGGTNGRTYAVTNHVVTSQGREKDKAFLVMVSDATPPTGGSGGGSDESLGVSIDHGSIGATLTITQAGSHELDLTTDATITVSTTGDVSLRVHGTGTVTVAGKAFEVDGVAVILVVTWPRGQDAYAAGAGASEGETPAVPDATPPSNITGLTATGGEGQITFNWSASTDAESTLGYRYRVWLTSGGATGSYVTRSSVGPVTVTGLAAGAYTVQVYAYSNGGASATASATATVTAVAGWSALVSDAFTGPDGTLGGHVPNVTPDGAAWTTGASPDFVAIVSNKITHNATGYNPAAMLLIPTQTAGIGVALDVALAVQPDTSTPALGISLKSPDNGDDLNLTIFMSAGALSVELSQGNGQGNVALTGTTSGLPLTGRYAMRWRQSNKSVSILRDGVEIATGTTANPSYSRDFKQVRLSMSGYKSSTVDNFVIESYT